MKAIIPIGGRGTRMRPVTFSANKHFIPVGNKLLIEYPIETVANAGITEIAITYNPGQLPHAKKILGKGDKWGVSFTYILQPKPKGLANIFQVCERWVGDEPFVLHLGDNIFTGGIKDLIDFFKEKQPNGLITMIRHPENKRMGVPFFNDQGHLVRYVEKPKEVPHDFAVPGVYIMDKNSFKCFKGENKITPSPRGELEIPTAFQWLIDNGYQVLVSKYRDKWLDPGKFDDWLDANRYLLDVNTQLELNSTLSEDSKIEGRVKIGHNCQITNSLIRGPTNIGDSVRIRNSFIGPYTSIYHGCEIDSCNLENSIIMGGCVLKKIEKQLDTSLIGPDSYINGHKNTNRKITLFVGELSQISL